MFSCGKMWCGRRDLNLLIFTGCVVWQGCTELDTTEVTQQQFGGEGCIQLYRVLKRSVIISSLRRIHDLFQSNHWACQIYQVIFGYRNKEYLHFQLNYAIKFIDVHRASHKEKSEILKLIDNFVTYVNERQYCNPTLVLQQWNVSV